MAKLHHLKFNDPAPDPQLLDMESKPVLLSSFWKRQVLVLAFTRHFGCPQCKEMIDQLVRALPQFNANDLKLVLITQGTPEETVIYCSQRAQGVTCLSDAGRHAYRAYGLERGSIWQTFFSLHVLRSNSRLRRDKGFRTELPPNGQDSMQMAGVFVIGSDGRIRLPCYYDDIADHPPVDLLLHGVLGVDWKKGFEGKAL